MPGAARTVAIDTYDDHRMAMSMALAGLADPRRIDSAIPAARRRPIPASLTTWNHSAMDASRPYNARYVWLISLAAALGGLLFGYDWVVIGGAKPFFERYFELTGEAIRGWANSCALFGCLCGALLRRGAERSVRPQAAAHPLPRLLFAVTSLGTALAPQFPVFVAVAHCWAAWPSAWPRTSRRCTSPRWRRPPCAAGWFRSTSSPS